MNFWFLFLNEFLTEFPIWSKKPMGFLYMHTDQDRDFQNISKTFRKSVEVRLEMCGNGSNLMIPFSCPVKLMGRRRSKNSPQWGDRGTFFVFACVRECFIFLVKLKKKLHFGVDLIRNSNHMMLKTSALIDLTLWHAIKSQVYRITILQKSNITLHLSLKLYPNDKNMAKKNRKHRHIYYMICDKTFSWILFKRKNKPSSKCIFHILSPLFTT